MTYYKYICKYDSTYSLTMNTFFSTSLWVIFLKFGLKNKLWNLLQWGAKSMETNQWFWYAVGVIQVDSNTLNRLVNL